MIGSKMIGSTMTGSKMIGSTLIASTLIGSVARPARGASPLAFINLAFIDEDVGDANM
jgi:hypothetical protein